MLQDKLFNKRAEIKNFHETHEFVLTGERPEMPICSKCHVRTARDQNRLNCDMDQSESARFCGKLNKHTDKKAVLKKLQRKEDEICKDNEKTRMILKQKKEP